MDSIVSAARHESVSRTRSLHFFALAAIAAALTGCGGREETIGGVQVPIPQGMTKSSQQGIEVALPGFSGAQVKAAATETKQTANAGPVGRTTATRSLRARPIA